MCICEQIAKKGSQARPARCLVPGREPPAMSESAREWRVDEHDGDIGRKPCLAQRLCDSRGAPTVAADAVQEEENPRGLCWRWPIDPGRERQKPRARRTSPIDKRRQRQPDPRTPDPAPPARRAEDARRKRRGPHLRIQCEAQSGVKDERVGGRAAPSRPKPSFATRSSPFHTRLRATGGERGKEHRMPEGDSPWPRAGIRLKSRAASQGRVRWPD